MPFDPPDIATDLDEITGRILDNLTEALPGWEPVEGDPLVALAEEIGRETAAANVTAVASIATAFAGIGESVHGIAARIAVAATLPATLQLSTTGATVPAGFSVTGVNGDGIEVGFVLLEATTATADTNSVAVQLVAAVDGAVGNDVPAGPLTVVTASDVVTSAAATGVSVGGVDEESLQTYLDRLVDELSVLRPGGVTATDMALLARGVEGVYRATAVDLYDPANPGVPTERTLTVFPVDRANEPVSALVKAAVLARLEAAREVNFVVHVADPTYTPLAIAFTVVVETDADPALTLVEVRAAIADYLAGWGSTPGDPEAWIETRTLRYLELARVAGSADGVSFLSALTVNGGTTDVTLAGPGALPAPLAGVAQPTTIVGTVA